jgi:hypothetical protein
MVASKSYDLFCMVMGASIPEARSLEGWEVSRLTISCAYRGVKFIPQIKEEVIQHILAFLDYHFELIKQGQNQDEPIQNALHALACSPGPAAISTLRQFDPTDSSFVGGIQYVFQATRSPTLRKAALLFFPLICSQWLEAGSLTMNQKQMESFCMDWASTLDCIEQTPATRMAALTALFEMINSPHWCPHIIPGKWALLEYPTLFPEGFQPPHSCINNPGLMGVIRGIDNPMAIVHWVTVLWLEYGALDSGVRDQLEATTKEISWNERQVPHFDTSRSHVSKWRANVASELRKATDMLKQYPMQSPDPIVVALEEKVEGLQLAARALNAIKQDNYLASVT